MCPNKLAQSYQGICKTKKNNKKDDPTCIRLILLYSGPDNWAANYSECAGDSNSPINIVKADATVMTAEEWELSGWDMTHTWDVTDQPYTGMD